MPCIRASDTSKAIKRGHTGANHRWIALALPAFRRCPALPAVLGLALVALPPLLLPRALAQPAAATIPLPEPRGQSLLLQSVDRADYGPLAEQFLTQANLAYCGVASMVMVLNSLAVPAPAAAGFGSYRFWTQENVFEAAATRAVLSPELVARQGMTLQELGALLASHGVQARAIHGDRLSLAQFRLLVRSNLARADDRLLVNYLRPSLGQAGGGHISPLAAYHTATDRVLILDVARYRYPSVWVPLGDLWQAIRTTDSSSGRSRGVVVVRRI
ncbi:phytochelatin synthase family protein [Synechococcus sp. Cruz-9H2]|uniref:phytochelatin synthase family protein n=1 Tax=unclassified Synechococcus TaxID=2626047 RepID=UPI0020CD6B1A|nr:MULTISPECIES: phytochelatin synthase family protein [unclassified Synechococcus]MCP9820767.1 phytochelatin synthase family protein [Synechococcus sp. Cruz-9H2]MCP9844977.1 phytochelatin synthase family protein [Synechococcus sp. Edmonson 11F2]MCP9857098.1 phytochelatin synthase family protein [Synechococcus sp. Cruz-9C9]MCP9864383.1 phytochelatin synthase family protein [Synechococcus sp. Cruz-7E5]MCP9871677.1 phytochelatin synthase family protein [Synechococcus sp. Cruz-7B9]